jgi:hypothetical protein
MTNKQVENILKYTLDGIGNASSERGSLAKVIRDLAAEREKLLSLCKRALKSWGDYRPAQNSNGYKVIKEMEAIVRESEQP